MKTFFISLAFFASLNALAVETASGPLERIYPTGTDRVYFSLKGDHCLGSEYYFFQIDSETKKAWYSLLLAAANTGRPVNVSLVKCPSDAPEEVRYIYQDF